MTDFQEKMEAALPASCLKWDEPMSLHTSFRIGGPARAMVFPTTREELAKALHMSEILDCKCAILGAGTNVLAPDEGLSGMVICLKDGLKGIERTGKTRIRVMAGTTMTQAAVYAAEQGLSGLEFAHGIPGTVGGGVYMNAGAYGGEIRDICRQVEILSPDGQFRVLTGEEMQFSYRHSILEDRGGIVVSAEFELTEKPKEEIRQTMRSLMDRRKASQPLELPSAGSAFKRPAGGYAAALIDQAGLKGFQVGGAAVSEKHAGFVVNLGGATAADVRSLLEQVSQRVYANSGIRLEPEVRIW